MVLKTEEEKFVLANVAANKKKDIKKPERLTGNKLRFATREEVLQATNYDPGSVPPFGELFGLPTFLDDSVLENDFVNFNIGMLTKSVKISKQDLLRMMDATISGFSKAN